MDKATKIAHGSETKKSRRCSKRKVLKGGKVSVKISISR